jgi:hypothetical protein
MISLLFPVSRQASGESRQNMVACAAEGALANLAEAGVCANEVEARFSSPWFWQLCRVKAMSEKKHFC